MSGSELLLLCLREKESDESSFPFELILRGSDGLFNAPDCLATSAESALTPFGSTFVEKGRIVGRLGLEVVEIAGKLRGVLNRVEVFVVDLGGCGASGKIIFRGSERIGRTPSSIDFCLIAVEILDACNL